MVWLSVLVLIVWGWCMGIPPSREGTDPPAVPVLAESVGWSSGHLLSRLADLWPVRILVARRRLRHLDLGEVLAEVAGRLRSGVSPAEAWGRAGERLGLTGGIQEDGLPTLLDSLPDGPAVAGARAACRLSRELGAPEAEILDECLVAVTQAEAEESARAVAIAGPAASARMLAALPAVGLLLAMALGADPLAAALGGGHGTVAVVAGVLAYGAGIAWTRKLVAEARSGSGNGGVLDGAMVLHLLRAALRSGVSVPRALQAVAEAGSLMRLGEAGQLLLLGAEWPEAWVGSEGAVALAGRALEPAWCDGADPVPLLERAAAAWYVRRDRRVREQAARLGVRLVMPLGICFLPAFMLVSVAPVLLATGGGLFSG